MKYKVTKIMTSIFSVRCKDSGSSSCPHPEEAVDTKEPMQGQLNNASPSYAGMVLKFTQVGQNLTQIWDL